MKLVTLVGLVFIGTLAIAEPNGRFFHNHCPDPHSDTGRTLGPTAAMQRYKGRLCRIMVHEFADPCESCLYRSPHNP